MAHEKTDLNLVAIFTVVIASSLFLLVVFIGAHAFAMYEEEGEVTAKWDESQNATLNDLLKDQRTRLNGPAGTMGATTKPSGMPIKEAMKAVVRNQGNIVFPAGK